VLRSDNGYRGRSHERGPVDVRAHTQERRPVEIERSLERRLMDPKSRSFENRAINAQEFQLDHRPIERKARSLERHVSKVRSPEHKPLDAPGRSHSHRHAEDRGKSREVGRYERPVSVDSRTTVGNNTVRFIFHLRSIASNHFVI
jgi:hypothetical protein